MFCPRFLPSPLLYIFPMLPKRGDDWRMYGFHRMAYVGGGPAALCCGYISQGGRQRFRQQRTAILAGTARGLARTRQCSAEELVREPAFLLCSRIGGTVRT